MKYGIFYAYWEKEWKGDFITYIEKVKKLGFDILEVGCGGGRICIPLAQAGHIITGFDADEHMLLRCYNRMKGMSNITCYLADALTSDWGSDFDVVVLAGNVLINIETDTDYEKAQQTFIQKAAIALKAGGHLLLDFDLHYDPIRIFNGLGEGSYFKGTDDMGTWGRTVHRENI